MTTPPFPPGERPELSMREPWLTRVEYAVAEITHHPSKLKCFSCPPCSFAKLTSWLRYTESARVASSLE